MVKKTEKCGTNGVKKLQTFVRRSCITGKIIWIYQGYTEEGARKAYQRARKKEILRVRGWKEHARKMKEDLQAFIDHMRSKIPTEGELTDVQKAALKDLKAYSKEEFPCDMGFYNHILEEAKRQNEASSRWRENRIRMFGRKEMNKKTKKS